MLTLLLLLFTKHFIVDFPLQPKWMYANKGTFAHLGGIAHAALHAAVTLAILLAYCDVVTAWYCAAAEFYAHYFIDWAKMNINRRLGWGPTTHESFWWLLGLDQWLHALCYFAIVHFAGVKP